MNACDFCLCFRFSFSVMIIFIQFLGVFDNTAFRKNFPSSVLRDSGVSPHILEIALFARILSFSTSNSPFEFSRRILQNVWMKIDPLSSNFHSLRPQNNSKYIQGSISFNKFKTVRRFAIFRDSL